MTNFEGAVMSAFTGVLLTDFDSFHKYAENILKRPVMSHEFASDLVMHQLKEASRKDMEDIVKQQTKQF